MTDVAAEPSRGWVRALGALGALLGVALVVAILALATNDSVALFVGVVTGAAMVCLTLLRLPRWRPAVIGVLCGMAGAYLAIFALLVLWIAGLGPT